MKLKAVKGTRDYLPKEAELREYMERTILECYRENGFQRIMTPIMEDIENLDKSEGGDNLNLIFKIMKRGEKLAKAIENKTQMADMGLRYDLTLPLSRYYSANRQNLPMPFKCIQIDKAFRAERNQKGRMREFIQCDIDIIGDSSKNCEIELITVTANALSRLDIGEFTVKVNDRRILNSLLLEMGFEKEQLSSVCISFDKLDKIGLEGVVAELEEKEFSINAINKFREIFSESDFTIEKAEEILVDADAVKSLKAILDTCRMLAEGKYKIEFDISLVRGQGYYTGTVFEIKSDKFSGSVAGGGRYDNLIGKFTGENISACGFSIGFERIFQILSDMNRNPQVKPKIAFIYDGDYFTAYNKAKLLREKYDVSLFERPKKMKIFLDKLQNSGFSGFTSDTEIKMF